MGPSSMWRILLCLDQPSLSNPDGLIRMIWGPTWVNPKRDSLLSKWWPQWPLTLIDQAFLLILDGEWCHLCHLCLSRAATVRLGPMRRWECRGFKTWKAMFRLVPFLNKPCWNQNELKDVAIAPVLCRTLTHADTWYIFWSPENHCKDKDSVKMPLQRLVIGVLSCSWVL